MELWVNQKKNKKKPRTRTTSTWTIRDSENSRVGRTTAAAPSSPSSSLQPLVHGHPEKERATSICTAVDSPPTAPVVSLSSFSIFKKYLLYHHYYYYHYTLVYLYHTFLFCSFISFLYWKWGKYFEKKDGTSFSSLFWDWLFNCVILGTSSLPSVFFPMFSLNVEKYFIFHNLMSPFHKRRRELTILSFRLCSLPSVRCWTQDFLLINFFAVTALLSFFLFSVNWHPVRLFRNWTAGRSNSSEWKENMLLILLILLLLYNYYYWVFQCGQPSLWTQKFQWPQN